METCEEMAEIVWQAYEKKRPIFEFSRRYSDFDLKMAYKVQKCYVQYRLAHDEIGGFKAGLTSKEVQRQFGFDEPVSGILFASGRLEESPVIDHSGFGHMLVEQEFGFEIGGRIAGLLKDTEALKSKVKSLRPVMELGDAGYGTNPADTPLLDLVAANCGSSHYIVGSPHSPGNVSLDGLQLLCDRDGVALSRWQNSEHEPDYWDIALWLANTIVSRRMVIEPGHILITGGLGKYFHGAPGVYHADFDELGGINFEIR